MRTTFPTRLAAIDIGSNAIRMLAAEFRNGDSFHPLVQLRLPVRLGHDAFTAGEITAPTMQEAIDGLRRFRASIEQMRIARCRAVATSAVRDSRNGRELVARAHAEAGVSIDVITGTEEAHLVHRAVRHWAPLGDRRWLLADLGGGSVELSIIDQVDLRATDTYPLGSVRLLEQLGSDYDFPRLKEVVDSATRRLESSTMWQADTAGFIATGGNIEALARLAGVELRKRSVPQLGIARLRELITRLAGLTYEDRIRQLGLSEDRADVILPAAVVYERIAALAGFESILVPAVGVKEGVLWDLLHRD